MIGPRNRKSLAGCLQKCSFSHRQAGHWSPSQGHRVWLLSPPLRAQQSNISLWPPPDRPLKLYALHSQHCSRATEISISNIMLCSSHAHVCQLVAYIFTFNGLILLCPILITTKSYKLYRDCYSILLEFKMFATDWYYITKALGNALGR